MSKSMNRKKNYVDKSIQGGLVRRIFFHWLTFFFVTALAVVAIKSLLGDPSVGLSDRVSAEVKDFGYLAIVIVALFPAFMLDTVRFSNRFVGTITRLRRHLKEMTTKGATDDIKFRDNDFWQPVAGEFNDMNEIFRQQQAEIADLKSQLNKTTQTTS